MPRIKKLIHTVVLLALCFLVFAVYLNVTNIGSNPRASLLKMMAGTADLPFQSRVLIPFTINILAKVLPANLFSPIEFPLFATAINNLSDHTDETLPAWLAIFLMFASLIGSVFVLQLLMRKLGFPSRAIYFWSVLYPLTLIVFFLAAYVYDFPSLVLFSAALYTLAPPKPNEHHPLSQWLFYLALFTLATLNKETGLLLLLVYALVYFGKLKMAEFVQWATAQAVIYAGIRYWLLNLYSNNPGSAVEYYWPLYLEFPLLLLISLLALAVLCFFIARNWHRKPLFLRQALIMSAPLLLLYFLFGYPFEIRVFLEAYPVVYLLLIFPKSSSA